VGGQDCRQAAAIQRASGEALRFTPLRTQGRELSPGAGAGQQAFAAADIADVGLNDPELGQLLGRGLLTPRSSAPSMTPSSAESTTDNI